MNFENENRIDFSNAPPLVTDTQVSTREATDNSFYASMLSGGDIVSKFTESMNQYLMEGNSSIVNNVTTILQNDQDKQRTAAIQGILGDDSIPIAQKKAVLNDYITTKTVPVELRTKYAEKVAATSTAYDGLSPEEFTNSFYAKEKAADNIQKQLNAYGREQNPSEATAFFGALVDLVPFIGSIGTNYDLIKLSDAIDNQDTNYLKDFFLGGEARVEIRDKLAKLDPQKQQEAITNLLNKLRNTKGFDYNKYQLLEDVVLNADYSTTQRVFDDVLGLFDVAAAKAASTVVKNGFKANLKVTPKSPLGTTAIHNPEAASKLATAAVMDESGRAADAIGEDKARIIADMFFTKVDGDVLTGVPSGMRQDIERFTQEGIEGYARSETTPFLYGQTVRDSVKERIYDTIQSMKQVSYHQSKSIINDLDEGVTGLATFGKTSDTPFNKLVDAEQVLENMKSQIPNGELQLVKVDPDTLEIVPVTTRYPEGEFYVQWKYNHTYNPKDAAIFGPVEMSLNIPFINKNIKVVDRALTTVAKTPVIGRFLFPATHYLDTWITRGALYAGDMHLALERPVLKKVQEAVDDLSRFKGEKQALYDFIERGSDEAKVFTYGEISQYMTEKGFKQAQVDKVAKAYFLNRRADDLAYLFVNRKTVEAYSSRGMQEISINGRTIHAKPLKTVPDDVKAVWDEAQQQIVNISKKELDELYSKGGSLGELAERITIGNKYVSHMLIPAGSKTSKLGDFILPRIPGHSPRYWKEYYFVQRVPLKAEVNGNTFDITDPNHAKVFDQLKTVHAAAGTKQEAVKLMEKLQKEFPDYKWEWRRERTDANTLVTDYNIYKEQLSHSMKRGDKLISIDGHARLEDPIIARYNSIKSVSRYAAYSEWADTFRNGFVKSYSRFLDKPGEFPTHITDLHKPVNASEADLSAYKEAVANYTYYQSIMQNRAWSEELWKESMYMFGEIFEKFSDKLSGVIKTIGKEWYPPSVLRSVAFTAFMALRPIRQLPLQASQILQYGLIDPKYMVNPKGWFSESTALLYGLSANSTPVNKWTKAGLKLLGKSDVLQHEFSIGWGAKIMGVSEKEYEEVLKAFKDSGLVASVDTNLLANGLFNQGTRGLNESITESIVKNTYSAVTAVSKIGKTVGMDAGEVINLTSAWLFARQRFMRMSPDVPWNSKVGLETIAVDARQISGEMTRGGELSWQRGFFALPMQFLAMPYKTLLGMFTSKVFTPAEKSRMIAGNLAFFGSFGLGLSTSVDELRENYGDVTSADTWALIKGGVTDFAANHVLNFMLDEKADESNMLAFSKAFSPLGDNIVPFTDVINNLQEKPLQTVLLGPSWSLFDTQKGRIPQALRDIVSITKREDLDTTDKIRRSMFEAAEISAGGTDWMKYQLALRTGNIISSTGHDTGLHADRKSMIGNLLGIQTYTELDYYKLQERVFDEDKEVKEAAKFLVNTIEQDSLKYGTDEWSTRSRLVSSYLSIMEDNPDLARKLEKEMGSIQYQLAKNKGENAYIRIYNYAQKLSQEDRVKLANQLRTSTDPRERELADKLNELTGIEAY